jgi:hypothetical protein
MEAEAAIAELEREQVEAEAAEAAFEAAELEADQLAAAESKLAAAAAADAEAVAALDSPSVRPPPEAPDRPIASGMRTFEEERLPIARTQQRTFEVEPAAEPTMVERMRSSEAGSPGDAGAVAAASAASVEAEEAAAKRTAAKRGREMKKKALERKQVPRGLVARIAVDVLRAGSL